MEALAVVSVAAGLVLMLLGLGLCAMWVWALYDVLRHEFSGNNKLFWILVLLVVPPVAACLYLVVGRKQKLPAGQ